MNNGTVFLIRNVSTKDYGGGETYQVELGKFLRQSGFRPIIFTNSKQLLAVAKKNKIETIVPPYNRKQNWSGGSNILLPIYLIWQVRLYFWYKKQMKKYIPVAINVQSRDDWIAATKAGKRCGVRVLWTDHMDFRSWVMNNVKSKYKNPIGKWILRVSKKADHIVMISECEARFAKTILPSEVLEKVLIIKNGVVDKKRQYNDMPSKHSICYVGRVVDYKGIRELIEAFAIVSAKQLGYVLNIYGDGELGEFKKLVGDLSVIFHGYTSKPLKAIAENEIFVLPSYKEGLSLSLLDAAMMGKKIIATSVGGNPEVVVDKKTGLLVPPKNVNKLARAMSWMIENEAKANEMAKNVRRLYKEKYDFEKIFEEQILPLYKE